MQLPIDNIIFNNIVEETGRHRQRNVNDVYKNYTLAYTMSDDGILYEKDIEQKLRIIQQQGLDKIPNKNRLIKDLTLIHKQLNIINITNTQYGICYIFDKLNKYYSISLDRYIKLLNHKNKSLLRLYGSIAYNNEIISREDLCKIMNININDANKQFISKTTKILCNMNMIDITTQNTLEYNNGRYINKSYNHYTII